MTLRTKVIYQERKVAAITKDSSIILNCLKKCPLVQIVNEETIKLLANGDALIVKIYGIGLKNASQSQVKKMVVPLLKDIKHQIKPNNAEDKFTVVFNSETSVAQFIERVKLKNLPINWNLQQKDPYECIKKSISYLLKERKNQGQQETQQSYNPPNYYYQNYYNMGYSGYDMNYYGYQQAPYKYEVFIRKAVHSDDDEISQINNKIAKMVKLQQKNEKSQQQSMGKKQIASKFNGDDFPQL